MARSTLHAREQHSPTSVSLVIIGDELLAGEVDDQNVAFIARALADAGIRVNEARLVPDEHERIVHVVRDELDASDAVLVTGGIGPTHDDLTRNAIAEVAGVPITRHADAEARLRAGFGGSVTDDELAMADLPAGARLLDGGTTPAFGFAVGSVFVLPGVPYYLRDIATPLIASWTGVRSHCHEVRTRTREGRFANRLRSIQDACAGVSIGSYPIYEDGFLARIVVRSTNPEAAADAFRLVQSLLDELDEPG